MQFLIFVRFLQSPAYLGHTFTMRNNWLVYADDEQKAMDRLESHLRSFLIDEPEVGDHMILEMFNNTIVV